MRKEFGDNDPNTSRLMHTFNYVEFSAGLHLSVQNVYGNHFLRHSVLSLTQLINRSSLPLISVRTINKIGVVQGVFRKWLDMLGLQATFFAQCPAVFLCQCHFNLRLDTLFLSKAETRGADIVGRFCRSLFWHYFVRRQYAYNVGPVDIVGRQAMRFLSLSHNWDMI